MAGDGGDLLDNVRGSIILVSVGSAALVLAISMAVSWCRSHVPTRSPPEPRGAFTPQNIEMASSFENSAAHPIPTHKYHKAIALAGDDGLCSVCLCEFEEGEELRTLPECLHSFHAPCIDMWLYSHQNCPMCRANALPSPQNFRPPVLVPVELESVMLQIVVQSRTRGLV